MRSPMRMAFARYVSIGSGRQPRPRATSAAAVTTPSSRRPAPLSTAIASRSGSGRTRTPMSASVARWRIRSSSSAWGCPETRIVLICSGAFEVALKAIEADEDRFRAPLRWSKRELTCLLAPQNPGDPQPDRASHVVAPAVEELGGDVGRLARAHEQHVVGAGAQLGCQRRAEKRIPAVRRPQIHAVEREEPVVHPVNRDARRARAALLARDGSVGDDEPGRAVSASAPRDARTKPVDATTKSVRPSRPIASSRRLARTESPTTSAPERTATAQAIPATTARFVRQK